MSVLHVHENLIEALLEMQVSPVIFHSSLTEVH